MREGERLNAYKDSKGVWTIGVGHTGHWITPDSVISQEESTRLFEQDIQWAERAVVQLVKVGLTSYQFDALVSFVFNIGTPQFSTSILLDELNKGNYFAVPSQLMRWDKITVSNDTGGKSKIVSIGLVHRRASELAQWSGLLLECNACGVSPSSPEGRSATKLLATSKTVQAGGVAAATGSYAFVTDLVEKAKELNASLLSVLPDANLAFIAMIGFGLFFMYNRYRDSKMGRAY